MSRNVMMISAIILLSLSLTLTGNAVHASAEDNKITQGVYIDEVDVSLMTKPEAEAAVKEYIGKLQSKGVAVKVHEDYIYSTIGELGYSTATDDAVDEALKLGKSGNLIKRYKDLKDIEHGGVTIELEFTYDSEKIQNLVAKEVSSYNIAPVNATVKRKNGAFAYTDHVIGSKVNIDETVKLIEEAINHWDRQDILVDAVVEDDMPLYTRDVVEQCNAVLGTFTTEYASSAQGRAANLANGARLINNTLLYPGDVFNAYNVLTPFTEENGYFVAGAYLNGVVVDSVGGGACQVTTTLYNAVLEAELEVVQRFPHSMTISYVDLSRDAAIAGTYKNFQFKNNTGVPILIEATTKDRRITFKLWGSETRDTKNRKIEYVTKVLSKTNPPADVVTKDSTKLKTYRKVTQSAHTGYRAQLWKVVYENGVEVSRTLVNSSSYSAAPQYVTVGTKEVEESKDEPKKDTSKDKPSTDNSSDENKNDDNTSENQTNQVNGSDSEIVDEDTQGWDPAWEYEE